MNKKKSMTTVKTLHGKPYAGNPHVRFDEGAGAPRHSGRSALLYMFELMRRCVAIGAAAVAFSAIASQDRMREDFASPSGVVRENTGPLFWLHGTESEVRLREYVRRVAESGQGMLKRFAESEYKSSCVHGFLHIGVAKEGGWIAWDCLGLSHLYRTGDG